MGANGSYDKKLGGVPVERRTHIETGHSILGHKVLLQDDNVFQTKNIMNSNSDSPLYLIAKSNSDGELTVLNINDFSSHQIGYEVNLQFDSNGNLKTYDGSEGHSHAHQWCQSADGNMHRKPIDGNPHLPIPAKYNTLISEIQKFNKKKHHIK